MATSTGVKLNEKQNEKLTQVYSPDQAKQFSFILERIKTARNQREQKWEYFDGSTYTQDYRLNRQAVNTYLRPKKNDDEVRINTGTTEKKIETVQNELLAMNLQPEVMAFDRNDNEIVDLGQDFSDIVKRTNEIEKDDDFYEESVKELLTQRAVFIRENYVKKTIFDKESKTKKTTMEYCEKELLSGLKVFLGDITIPAYKFETQPYLVVVDRVPYRTLEQTWDKNENWKYVKAGKAGIAEFDGLFDYRVGELSDTECEVAYYYSFPDDEYQVFINSVMMEKSDTGLPYNFPEYNIKMVVLKSMSPDFAYGKPLTASAKTLQGLNNETIRLLVRKFRQALAPPMGVKSNKVYSKDIWAPGALTQGLKKDMFEKLVDHDGVTAADMTMFKLIEEKTEEFIGSSNLQSGMTEKGLTATQAVEQLKQGLKMLGLSVSAVMKMKRDMTFLRIYNVLENHTKPVGKRLNDMTSKVEDVHRKFTLRDTDLGRGKMGKKVIEFTNQEITEQDENTIKDFEEEEEKKGKPVRLHFINIQKLEEIEKTWFVTVVEKEQEGSSLEKIMFQDKLQQSVAIQQISGRRIAGDRVVDNFERLWQAPDWFEDEAQLSLEEGVEGSGQGQDLKKGATGNQLDKPSLNNLASDL